MPATELTNARIEVVRSTDEARIIRVFPDGPKMAYRAGQYGSLGLQSTRDDGRLVRRAYSISSPIVDLASLQLIDPRETDYYEFYFNLVPDDGSGRERLSPKLFTLQTGDRIFCGQKIVGYYALDGALPENFLFVATETGEAPNNSLVGQLLLENRTANLCNIVVGRPGWRTLYENEHRLVAEKYPHYRFVEMTCQSIQELFQFVRACLDGDSYSRSALGFSLAPGSTHVYLCGDPTMIGAPRKKGGWTYEYVETGMFGLLTSAGFTETTRFKKGNLNYESYW